MERRTLEISLLKDRYGEAEIGPNLEYLIFKKYRLPPSWSQDTTELLVLIPPGYPMTPPDNFYVSNGLRLQSGQMPGNYGDGNQQLGRSWGFFSVHIDGEWKPSADLLHGDNLMTFMFSIVEKRLKELN
jgi:hypothetical protein